MKKKLRGKRLGAGHEDSSFIVLAIDEEISTLEIVKRVGPFLMSDQSRSGTSHTTLGEAVRSCRLSMFFVWAKRGNAAVINRVMMVRFINAPAAFDAESCL
jgi:hypothetical protein